MGGCFPLRAPFSLSSSQASHISLPTCGGLLPSLLGIYGPEFGARGLGSPFALAVS